MGRENLIQKLKTGITALAILGSSYINFTTAQEIYKPKYNEITTHHIIKEIQKENAFITPKILDDISSQSKQIVKENYNGDSYNTENAKNLMKKLDSEIFQKYPELNIYTRLWRDSKDPICYHKS